MRQPTLDPPAEDTVSVKGAAVASSSRNWTAVVGASVPVTVCVAPIGRAAPTKVQLATTGVTGTELTATLARKTCPLITACNTAGDAQADEI